MTVKEMLQQLRGDIYICSIAIVAAVGIAALIVVK